MRKLTVVLGLVVREVSVKKARSLNVKKIGERRL